jgi:uncharacterized phiE125 gp8 family phage protein
MNTVLITAPVELPVSLPEVKNFLKIEDSVTEDDALIVALMRAAAAQAESYLNRKLITQTWELKLDRFPCGDIEIPYGTLQSVTSITYTDTDQSSQTWATSQYQVDTSGVLGRIAPVYGVTYPSTYDQYNAVVVRFTCGYGTAPASVPEEIRVAILMTIQDWYDKRSEGSLPRVAELLMAAQRIMSFA